MRVEQLQREYAVEAVWEPFELHPEIPVDGIPVTDLMRQTRAPSIERLRLLAEEAGIPMRELSVIPNSRLALEEALTTHRYRERVYERIDWARERGITSTPTFIFDDRFALVGAQEYAVFERVAQRMGARRRSP